MFKKALVVAFLGALTFLSGWGIRKAFAAAPIESKTGIVELSVQNPYRISVSLEVKCNWVWQTRSYTFYQIIIIPGKKGTLIKVPNNLTSCEIWPKIHWGD